MSQYPHYPSQGGYPGYNRPPQGQVPPGAPPQQQPGGYGQPGYGYPHAPPHSQQNMYGYGRPPAAHVPGYAHHTQPQQQTHHPMYAQQHAYPPGAVPQARPGYGYPPAQHQQGGYPPQMHPQRPVGYPHAQHAQQHIPPPPPGAMHTSAMPMMPPPPAARPFAPGQPTPSATKLGTVVPPPPPGLPVAPPGLSEGGAATASATSLVSSTAEDSGGPAPMSVDGTAPNQDLLTTVFLSKIPTSVSEELIEKILNVCGPVKTWKALLDEHGKPYGSGFCVFETRQGALRALKLLGGQVDLDTPVEDASTATGADGGEVEEGEESHGGLSSIGIFIVKADQETWRFLKQKKEDIKTGDDQDKKMEEATEEGADSELAAQKELDSLLKEVKESRAQQFLSSFMMGSTEATQNDVRRESDDEDDAEHIRRIERREKDKVANFLDRERRFENAEQARLRRIAHDELMDKEHEDRRAHHRETMAKKLASFDDELEKDKEEFFYDRERWWARRQHERQRELEWDERDRRAEADEHVFAKEHEDESAARAAASTQAAAGFVVSRIMTKEERIAAIQDLISRIPEEKEGLWEWNIKWQFLDDAIVNGKIRPFLEKKMVELIGQVENELLEFVLEKIRAQATAQQITDELTPLMDQETEVFVMKLWRMVIYETEARSEGL